MLPFGHIGFGILTYKLKTKITNPSSTPFDSFSFKALFKPQKVAITFPVRDLLFAIFTLLPDLIDKPLYYFKIQVPFFGFAESTRFIGHASLPWIVLGIITWGHRNFILKSLHFLSGAILIHHGLDMALDQQYQDFLWPFFPWPQAIYDSLQSHVFHHLTDPAIMLSELLGILLCVGFFLKQTPEITSKTIQDSLKNEE